MIILIDQKIHADFFMLVNWLEFPLNIGDIFESALTLYLEYLLSLFLENLFHIIYHVIDMFSGTEVTH